MSSEISRRRLFLEGGLALAGGLCLANRTSHAAEPANGDAPSPQDQTESAFRYCLNTSTIRGRKLPLPEVVDIAAKAGYGGIEPWIREIEAYERSGGSLDDLKQRIADHGLKVESAIGFAPWLVDDDANRAAGLKQAEADMRRVRAIGGTRIAAPPAGVYNQDGLDLDAAAARYRELLERGAKLGVVPQLEFWGSAKSLYRLAQATYIAVQAGHPDSCLLPDIYHMFRGGSDFAGLSMIAGSAIHCFHVNDYPGDIPRPEQNDSHRVYPGDGVAPLRDIFRTLQATGFRGALSLELFNREYWKQDPLEVARTGLKKTQEAVAASLAK